MRFSTEDAQVVAEILGVHVVVGRDDHPNVRPGNAEVEQGHALIPHVLGVVANEDPQPGGEGH